MSREKRKEKQAARLEKQRNRQVKLAVEPNPQKEPKSEQVIDFEKLTVQWCFSVFDYAMDWRDAGGSTDLYEIGDQFKSFSRMTWEQVRMQAARDHVMNVDVICATARQRLIELGLDDIDELWSFRFGAKRRVWGIRDGRVMKVVWWDPEHQVYPTQPRNT